MPHNEALESMTFDLISPLGYPCMYTIRAATTESLLAKKVADVEQLLKAAGFTAKPARSFGGGFPKKEINYVEGRMCPTCGERLVKVNTKKGELIKCSTSKYDFATKTSSGCKFVEWPTLPQGVDAF